MLRIRLPGSVGHRHHLARSLSTTSAINMRSVPPPRKSGEKAGETGSIFYWPKIYLELGKFRLSGLVVATTASGYYMGCTQVDPNTLAITLAGTSLAALSANTLNQWYEMANDAKMGRTQSRPLPSGRISPSHALAFGIGSGLVGSTLLTSQINILAGGLALGNIALYAGVYTPMKVRHPVNTWIGAVVGGLPPLIGYAAATNQLDSSAGILAALLFSWQFPHFMALAHYCKKDYMAGGYQMLSDKRAAAVALRHSLYMIPMGIAAPTLGMTTWLFGFESIIINCYIAHHSYQFWRSPTIRTAKQLFRTSLWHLPALLLLMAFHKVQTHSDEFELVDIFPEESWIFPLPKQI